MPDQYWKLASRHCIQMQAGIWVRTEWRGKVPEKVFSFYPCTNCSLEFPISYKNAFLQRCPWTKISKWRVPRQLCGSFPFLGMLKEWKRQFEEGTRYTWISQLVSSSDCYLDLFLIQEKSESTETAMLSKKYVQAGYSNLKIFGFENKEVQGHVLQEIHCIVLLGKTSKQKKTFKFPP